MNLDKLIAKLESATEGSRELDEEIGRHLGIEPTCEYWPDGYEDCGMGGSIKSIDWPRYTTSLDAALALVPEGWRYFIRGPHPNNKSGLCKAGLWQCGKGEWYRDYPRGLAPKNQPALALCIAALKARQSIASASQNNHEHERHAKADDDSQA